MSSSWGFEEGCKGFKSIGSFSLGWLLGFLVACPVEMAGVEMQASRMSGGVSLEIRQVPEY